MKKTVLLPLALGAVLICGCERNSNADRARLDALTQKMDLVLQNQLIVCSNQATMFKEIEAVKTQVATLPTIQQVDAMTFYFHTNAIDVITAGQADVLSEIRKLGVKPTPSVGEILESEQRKDMARDVFLMSGKIDGIQEDLSTVQRDLLKIKMHMGLF